MLSIARSQIEEAKKLFKTTGNFSVANIGSAGLFVLELVFQVAMLELDFGIVKSYEESHSVLKLRPEVCLSRDVLKKISDMFSFLELIT